MTSDTTAFTIRALSTHDELRACERVQRLTWNMIDSDIVPMHLLVAFVLHGGIVLGADKDGEIVGFLFGYPGMLSPDDERTGWMGTPFFHASQMLGVLPEYQNSGIGFELKKRQREAALEQGFRLATWTFDPLLSRNAHFNITRLGGVCRHYIRDIYGELPGLNAGLPTDRFEVEWWIASQRVRRCIEKPISLPPQAWRMAGAVPAYPTSRREDGLRVPADRFDLSGGPRLMAEIPGDFPALKAADMGLAQAWRMHLREVMEAAFQQGYTAAWFASGAEEGERRSFYILELDMDISKLATGEA